MTKVIGADHAQIVNAQYAAMFAVDRKQMDAKEWAEMQWSIAIEISLTV